MLPEISFLRLFMIFEIYQKYYSYIKVNKDIYRELYIIYNVLPIYFEKFPFDSTLDEFSSWFFIYYPRLKQEEIDAYQTIFAQAAKIEVSPEKAEDLLRTIADRNKAIEIARHALDVSEGRKDMQSLREATTWELESLPVTTVDIFITDDLAELKHETVTKPGLRWRLPSLNRALGSLRLGDFGFVFARPETGKTTFLASEVTHFATQVEAPIIWFNNEEQGNKVKLRCFQAALGLPLEKLFSNVERNQRDYDAITSRRIKIYDEGNIFKADVERIIKKEKPALIIFDQIDKIAGFSADRNDLVMGAIYQWAREIAKSIAPVIGVCQADGTGDGVQWLTMAHVADAKTAKQAEADWMLGIGRVYDDQQAKVRFMNISKNKLQGDADSDPEWRHAKWPVLIQAEIARYEDIGK